MKRKKRITNANRAKGADYVPFIKTHHIPSTGIVSRIPGWKTGRIHHVLSKLERQFFYLLDWLENVTDIREQYALTPEHTQEIAQNLGVIHPRLVPTKEPIVMTTDFLVSFANAKPLAISVKPSAHLDRKRVIEKLELERTYWKENDTEFRIATEKEVPLALVQNVEWVHDARNNPLTKESSKAAEEMLARLLCKGQTLAKAGVATDRALNLEVGSSLTFFRHLIASRRWKTDMTVKIKPSQTLRIIHG